ncbi:MAG TPA: type II secretion system minor pseudopilin GspJ [Gammaproteobacteria bacterium]|nr:type II secretion system minor pseudopilin GspJ [Gammaproteobacteria bacterium]
MAANHKKNRGFTLLEIIIALFIFSIVSVILVTALHTTLGTQSSAEKKAARLAELQVALLLMSRDIEQVIDRPIMTASGQMEGFVGTAQTVTFTHTGFDNPFGQLQRSTLQRTRYQLNQGTLERLTWPMLDQAKETSPDVRSLLTNVSALRFEYLDDKNHFQTSWPVSSDPHQSTWPVAVRVSLTVRDWGQITQLYLLKGQPIEPSN